MASLAVVASIAPRARAQGNLRGIVRLGGDFGGDKVLQFQYSDGSTPNVPAGGGLLLSGGAAVQLLGSTEQALDVQASVGVKYRTIPPASNQNATWARFPVEGLLMYRSPFGLRLGGGAAVHLGNVLEASGSALNSRVEFKPTPGFVAQTEYGLGAWAFDLRYTMMKYEVSKGGSGTVSANSLGAGLSYAFGSSTSRAAKAR
ncbi:MAG: hypothetical protein ACJ8AD_06635 [Gemmatimonadaceae bacterium]